jgi:hypothetical protein
MPGARAPPVIEETQRKVPVQLAVNDADAFAVIKPTLAVIAGLGPVGTAGTTAVPLNGAAGLTSCMAIIWPCDWPELVYENHEVYAMSSETAGKSIIEILEFMNVPHTIDYDLYLYNDMI